MLLVLQSHHKGNTSSNVFIEAGAQMLLWAPVHCLTMQISFPPAMTGEPTPGCSSTLVFLQWGKAALHTQGLLLTQLGCHGTEPHACLLARPIPPCTPPQACEDPQSALSTNASACLAALPAICACAFGLAASKQKQGLTLGFAQS